MIFDELVLHNFGAYLGRQVIELTPPTPDKPVVLVGGLNGGGKTTFLDAIQLALYGRRAQCSSWTSGGYDSFLRESINRRVPRSEGAAVELAFSRVLDGEVQQVRVKRAWYENGSSITENVAVIRDGEHDEFMTQSWDEVIEGIVPKGVAGLFLFDGEKLERLADPERSREVLSTAVQSLLGVDIVDQLVTDLTVLRRRKLTDEAGANDQAEIQEHKEDVARLEKECDHITLQKGEVVSDLDRLQRRFKELDSEYKAQGGESYEARVQMEAHRTALLSRLSDSRERLRMQAAGAAPLLLLNGLLADISQRVEEETKTKRAKVLNSELLGRDEALLAFLDKKGADELTCEVKTWLETDRAELQTASEKPVHLNLSVEGSGQLNQLLNSGLEECRSLSGQMVRENQDIVAEIEAIDRQLAAVPDKDTLANLVKQREEVSVALETTQRRADALDEQLESAHQKLEETKAKLTRVIERQVARDFDREADKRVVRHAEKAKETLRDFRTAVVSRHTTRIADLVLQSFRSLLRKDELVSRLEIDPQTYKLTLFDNAGAELPPERFSAGERQLLAVSILWGLARASGKGLPTVIDTPMGRLDSVHRDYLVNRYFPMASHQVVLLSTDEEIVGDYYSALSPWVGREWQLQYDNASKSTTVESGYFGGNDAN